jgi:periplasmic protein CpxP/Spy
MNRITSRLATLGFTFTALALAPLLSASAQDTQNSNPSTGSSMPSDASHGMMQHAAPDPQKAAARMAKQLGLSDDQTSKLTSILQDRQQKMAALKGDTSSSPQDRRQKQRSIQQDSDTQINGILTPDQQTKYTQMKQAMKQRWQDKHAAPGESSTSGS